MLFTQYGLVCREDRLFGMVQLAIALHSCRIFRSTSPLLAQCCVLPQHLDDIRSDLDGTVAFHGMSYCCTVIIMAIVDRSCFFKYGCRGGPKARNLAMPNFHLRNRRECSQMDYVFIIASRVL